MDREKMQITEQFGLKKSLDHLFQLIFISTNLFASMEFENGLGFITIDDTEQKSQSELQQLLAYFLDLVDYFTHEKVQLIQDVDDNSRYALSGGF